MACTLTAPPTRPAARRAEVVPAERDRVCMDAMW